MKRSYLKKVSTSPVSDAKKEIQRLLREIVIIRDKKCQRCGVPYPTEGVVFQCDHLLSRSNSATYAVSKLCVLLCKPCHAWKSLGSNLRKKEYDELMRAKLSKEVVALWDRCEEERSRFSTGGKYDWEIEIVALNQYLKKISTVDLV